MADPPEEETEKEETGEDSGKKGKHSIASRGIPSKDSLYLPPYNSPELRTSRTGTRTSRATSGPSRRSRTSSSPGDTRRSTARLRSRSSSSRWKGHADGRRDREFRLRQRHFQGDILQQGAAEAQENRDAESGAADSHRP